MLMMYLALIEESTGQSLFEQIYYTYRQQMFFVANSMLEDKILAEDAVQEAFFGIARQITLLRDMREERRRLYVLTAAKNSAINILRRENKQRQIRAEYERIRGGIPEDATMNAQITKETRQAVLAAFGELPPLQRDILTLRCAHGMNCQQIALTLGRNPSTVRKELSRARRTLREKCRRAGVDIED